MRIACLTRITLEHGVRGGMEQHTAQLAAGLRARGHEVVTITTPLPDGAQPQEADTTIMVAKGKPGRYSGAWRAGSWRELAVEHRRQPFDVILSVSAGAQSLIRRARRELGLPAVVILHGTMGGDWRTRWRDRRSLRGLYRMARYGGQLPLEWQRWRLARADVAGWIAVSNEVKADWMREMGVAGERIAVVPNGVDVDRFAPDPAARAAVRAELDVDGAAPLLVGVGRLEEEKGFQVALRALARLRAEFPAARLVIAGDGVYRPRLEQLARDLGLGEAARFLGYLPNAELPRLLAAADIFVMPSLRHEGFPVTIAEALASGTPVLASRAGGTPSAITEDLTGRLLPMGDLPAWTAAIRGLLRDSRRRQAMGLLARQVAVRRFSEQAMLDGIERALSDAAGQWTN